MTLKSNLISLIAGIFILVLGVALILIWWPRVVDVFKGGIGIILALAGLLVLYTVQR